MTTLFCITGIKRLAAMVSKHCEQIVSAKDDIARVQPAIDTKLARKLLSKLVSKVA